MWSEPRSRCWSVFHTWWISACFALPQLEYKLPSHSARLLPKFHLPLGLPWKLALGLHSCATMPTRIPHSYIICFCKNLINIVQFTFAFFRYPNFKNVLSFVRGLTSMSQLTLNRWNASTTRSVLLHGLPII
jgi:hypothetical protein